jgi:uncharacterized protein (TIGR00251 family)
MGTQDQRPRRRIKRGRSQSKESIARGGLPDRGKESVWIAHKPFNYYGRGRFVFEREIISMSTPAFVRAQTDGVLLAIKLQPRASVNQVGEALGNELRIKVTAPPVDSAANEALVRLLAEVLECGRNQVELVRGHTSRHKVVKITGVSERAVAARLSHA